MVNTLKNISAALNVVLAILFVALFFMKGQLVLQDFTLLILAVVCALSGISRLGNR